MSQTILSVMETRSQTIEQDVTTQRTFQKDLERWLQYVESKTMSIANHHNDGPLEHHSCFHEAETSGNTDGFGASLPPQLYSTRNGGYVFLAVNLSLSSSRYSHSLGNVIICLILIFIPHVSRQNYILVFS
jgi:hypothetical protein